MCPGVMRLTDPRFLSERRHKNFKYFLETQVGDLSVDKNVDRMVEMCFSKQSVPGLEATFWRFENIDAVRDHELMREISSGIKRSARTLGLIASILTTTI